MRFRAAFILLLILVSASFFASLYTGRGAVGRPFPGFLSFQNGVAGAFHMPSWEGPKRGVRYHDTAPAPAGEVIFSEADYAGVVLFPAVSGLLFFLLGAFACLYLPGPAGRGSLLAFHFLAAEYMILSPDFHLTHRFDFFLLAAFAFLPAAMVHFALAFPEPETPEPARPAWAYAASLALAVPYFFFFRRNPAVWVCVEYAVVAYTASAYLFWMARLAMVLRRSRGDLNRLLARHLLIGQVVGFAVPFGAAIAIFVLGFSVPLNFAAPFALLFPLSLLLGVVLARLRQGQVRLVQAERFATLGTLMAGLAHELKNPLNFVVANIDALKSQAATPAMKEIADDIEEGAERLRTILDDFRFFAGPDRKEKVPVDLNEVVRHAANLLRPRCGEKVVMALHLNEIPKVTGDAGALGQAALNLMANAIEAIAGEGEVSVTTDQRGGRVILSVRDNGPGIPPENLKRIFDPFFTTKPQGQGTGLGLALTERIVREHGGRIEVKSEVGKGSELVVRLDHFNR